jgi:PEP-CTERM motif
MKISINALLTLLTLTLTLVIAPPIHASVMLLDMSGTLGGATNLNGSALGADTAFTLHAVFDSTPINTAGPNRSWYAATTTLNINGHNALNGALPVYLDSFTLFGTHYFAGIASASGDAQNLLTFSSDNPSPVIDTQNPAPTFFAVDGSSVGGTLTFGTDTISTINIVNTPSTLQINYSNAVPEPSTYALLCLSLGVVGYARKKMNKSRLG